MLAQQQHHRYAGPCQHSLSARVHGGRSGFRSSRRARAATIDPASTAAPTDDTTSSTAAADSGASGASANTANPFSSGKKTGPYWALSDGLDSVSITIVGDDTALNWAVCQALSKKIGWFPVSAAKVLCGIHKAEDVSALEARLGGRAVVAAEEARVLRGLREQFRCCVATLGDGAAAELSSYANLWGSVVVWLDEESKRSPKPPSAARAAYALAEVRAKVAVSTGFGSAESLEERAKRAVGPLVRALNQMLEEHPYLPAKKRRYIELGCRGDWPELQPPEWSPALEAMGRGALGAGTCGAAAAGGEEAAEATGSGSSSLGLAS